MWIALATLNNRCWEIILHQILFLKTNKTTILSCIFTGGNRLPCNETKFSHESRPSPNCIISARFHSLSKRCQIEIVFHFSIFSYPDATLRGRDDGEKRFSMSQPFENFFFSFRKRKICLRGNFYASLFFRSGWDVEKVEKFLQLGFSCGLLVLKLLFTR